VIYLVLTRPGYEELRRTLLDLRRFDLWAANGVLRETELGPIRDSGSTITVFDYSIGLDDEEATQRAIDTICQHHPNEAIWVEGRDGGRPDRLEKKIRFGCGFVFGVFSAALSSFAASLYNGWYLVALLVGIGIIFGFLAMRYGDKFWHSVPDWWWPPWW
jgi:hypothetical protein